MQALKLGQLIELEVGGTDGASPIVARFSSGMLGCGDPTAHKIYRKLGLQVSAPPGDVLVMKTRTAYTPGNTETDSTPLTGGSLWNSAQWGSAAWSVNSDGFSDLIPTDALQGRYLQVQLELTTTAGGQAAIIPPLTIEHRPRYRFARG